MFDQNLYSITYVKDLMTEPDGIIDPEDSMDTIIQLFQKSQRYNLPVIENGRYIGFISRATVFSQYRELLKKMSDD
jgi:CIC family chloride channel protein